MVQPKTEEKEAPPVSEMIFEEKEKPEEEQESSEEVAEEEGEKEEEKSKFPTFSSQDEVDAFVEERAKPIAQSMKDKELQPVYDENQTLKKTNTDLKRQLEHQGEDTALSRMEEAEIKEHGDTVEVKDVQEVRREVVKLGRANEKQKSELSDIAERLHKTGLQQTAFEKALKLFLPEDKEFLSTIEAFAEKLLKATTQGEMDLLYQLEEKVIKGDLEAKVKAKRPPPDRIIASTQSGKKASEGSIYDSVAAGFKELEKKEK